MKRRTPGGIWVLRAVTVVVAAIVILIIGAVAYSVYQDFSTIRSELTPGSSPVQSTPTLSGGMTLVATVNITNSGLFPLDVTIACDGTNPNVVCTTGHVSVPPGQHQVLKFKMTVPNLQQYLASTNKAVNGTVTAGLAPFASITVKVDLSSLVRSGSP